MEPKNVITSIRLEESQYKFLTEQRTKQRKSLNSLIMDAIDLLIEQKKEQE